MNDAANFCLLLLLTSLSPINAEGEGKTDSDKAGWEVHVILSILGGALAVFGVLCVVSAIGFRAAGVAVGSVAALIQSVVYGGAVAAGSIFAVLQRAGAVGMRVEALLTIFLLGAGATFYLMY